MIRNTGTTMIIPPAVEQCALHLITLFTLSRDWWHSGLDDKSINKQSVSLYVCSYGTMAASRRLAGGHQETHTIHYLEQWYEYPKKNKTAWSAWLTDWCSLSRNPTDYSPQATCTSQWSLKSHRIHPFVSPASFSQSLFSRLSLPISVAGAVGYA